MACRSGFFRMFVAPSSFYLPRTSSKRSRNGRRIPPPPRLSAAYNSPVPDRQPPLPRRSAQRAPFRHRHRARPSVASASFAAGPDLAGDSGGTIRSISWGMARATRSQQGPIPTNGSCLAATLEKSKCCEYICRGFLDDVWIGFAIPHDVARGLAALGCMNLPRPFASGRGIKQRTRIPEVRILNMYIDILRCLCQQPPKYHTRTNHLSMRSVTSVMRNLRQLYSATSNG
jgi:hypothetical protein